ncbi:hypothetical protein BH11PSE3_BH11PSE3_25680 [soil metagenome]
MKLSRLRFIEQFALTHEVQCLRHWPRRSKQAPTFLTPCLCEWIRTAGGRMKLGESAFEGPAFGALARPIIEELHRLTPAGERPDAKVLAGRLHDALDSAGVEVSIQPPPGPCA